MGHVLADHVGLTTTLQLVQMILGGAIRAVPLAGVPLVALYLALLEWSRAAELTSDRASAIVTGEPLVVCQTLMRMAGGPVADLNLDAFLRQATEYAEEKDPFAALLPVLRRDHDDPSLPGATGAGTDHVGERRRARPDPCRELSPPGSGTATVRGVRRGPRALPRAFHGDARAGG